MSSGILLPALTGRANLGRTSGARVRSFTDSVLRNAAMVRDGTAWGQGVCQGGAQRCCAPTKISVRSPACKVKVRGWAKFQCAGIKASAAGDTGTPAGLKPRRYGLRRRPWRYSCTERKTQVPNTEPGALGTRQPPAEDRPPQKGAPGIPERWLVEMRGESKAH